jgi:dipeptidyl aminopeptidase/acylaminoacyl peptidase
MSRSRVHRLLLACVAGLAVASASAAAPPDTSRVLTPDVVSRFRDVGDPRVSPDGAWVAYTVRTTDATADRRQTDLWMTSWDGATTVRLTTTEKASESAPRWSPDGRWLAFLSSREDEHESDQVWLLPRAGGEAERITSFPGGVSDYAWSPDGARMVFVVADSDSVAVGGEGAKAKTAPPIVIDRYYFKEDITGYVTRKRSHLVAWDLATRVIAVLTRGDHDEQAPVWSPDGRSVAFLGKRGPDADRTNSWEILVQEARAGAEERAVTRYEGRVNNPGGDDRIAWSPDGASLAFVQGGPEKLIYYAVNHLAVVPAAGGPVRVLTATLDRWVSEPTWAPDGRSILVGVEEDRTQHVMRVPLDGGAPVPVTTDPRVVSGFDVGPSGRIALLLTSPTAPPEVHALDERGVRRLTHVNDALLAGLDLATTERMDFTSRDGTAIGGFMVKPPEYRPGTRYPAILRIHGGPVGQFRDEFEMEWQVLAARGYVVIAANPRGSSGRGQEFSRVIFADWGNKDVEDVLAAVDKAVALGVADPARLGVGGWSYGGMLTNYVIARDARFKAATSGASTSNILAGYGTDMYIREYEAELGPPWTSSSAYLKLSYPFLHADRIVTPTLFLCGQSDFNVPLLNSEQMYQALRSLGRETELVIYPGQFHGIRKPSYVRDHYTRYLDWYDRFLKR